MCLSYIDFPKEDEMSGIGWKVVRKNDDGTYSPYYQYADKNGDGCCNYPIDRSLYFKNKMVYRIDKPYVVKHNRKAHIQNRSYLSYPAGVHLYLNYKNALWKFAEADQMSGNFAIIKCKYEKALAIDRLYRIIVANKITPIEETMETTQEP